MGSETVAGRMWTHRMAAEEAKREREARYRGQMLRAYPEIHEIRALKLQYERGALSLSETHALRQRARELAQRMRNDLAISCNSRIKGAGDEVLKLCDIVEGLIDGYALSRALRPGS